MSLKKESRIPLFNTSQDILKVFMPFAKEKHYKAGKLIFKEGSSGSRFFFIKEGEVQIIKIIDRKMQQYHRIAVLIKGDFFGEMAVFLGQRRSADAQAKTDVSLLEISRDSLSTLLKSNHKAASHAMGFFTAMLTKRLDNTTREFVTAHDIGRLVTASKSISGLADNVMPRLLSTINSAKSGFFVVWNEFNRAFEVIWQRGFDLKENDLLYDDPFIKWFTKNPKEAFLSFDFRSDQRVLIPEGSLYTARSIMACPFFLKDRLSGFMLFLNRTKQNAFSYNQMLLLSSIGSYVSVAIENLRHMQDEIDRYRLSQTKSNIVL